MTGYTLKDHTADVMVEAEGNSLEEVFEQAAKGTFACMADLHDIDPDQTTRIDIHANDLKSLLYDFIDELIYHRDIENMLFSEFDVAIEHNEKYRLTASLHGADIGATPARDVKAPTYSDMEVFQQENGSYLIRVVLDI